MESGELVLSKDSQIETQDSKCPCAKCFIAVDAAKLLTQKDIIIDKLQSENSDLKKALDKSK